MRTVSPGWEASMAAWMDWPGYTQRTWWKAQPTVADAGLPCVVVAASACVTASVVMPLTATAQRAPPRARRLRNRDTGNSFLFVLVEFDLKGRPGARPDKFRLLPASTARPYP